MYAIHGWIELAESPAEIDQGALEQKCAQLRGMVQALAWPSGKMELLLLNGMHVLTMHALPNRRRSEAEDLNRVLDFVLREFKGAYGIIYEYDKQTVTSEGRGVYSVRVIRRGRCELALDPFLSPFVPVAEDPGEES